jgi:hypothetical protein
MFIYKNFLLRELLWDWEKNRNSDHIISIGFFDTMLFSSTNDGHFFSDRTYYPKSKDMSK